MAAVVAVFVRLNWNVCCLWWGLSAASSCSEHVIIFLESYQKQREKLCPDGRMALPLSTDETNPDVKSARSFVCSTTIPVFSVLCVWMRRLSDESSIWLTRRCIVAQEVTSWRAPLCRYCITCLLCLPHSGLANSLMKLQEDSVSRKWRFRERRTSWLKALSCSALSGFMKPTERFLSWPFSYPQTILISVSLFPAHMSLESIFWHSDFILGFSLWNPRVSQWALWVRFVALIQFLLDSAGIVVEIFDFCVAWCRQKDRESVASWQRRLRSTCWKDCSMFLCCGDNGLSFFLVHPPAVSSGDNVPSEQ